jgi:hypothetical protein
MTTRAIKFLVLILILSGSMPTRGLEIVSDITQFGRLADDKTQLARVMLLMSLHLGPEKDTDPTFINLLENVNQELDKHHANFHVVVHVDASSENFWKLVKNQKLSSLINTNPSDEKGLRAYLQTATAWDVLTDLGQRLGFANPGFFDHVIVISSTIGFGGERSK